MDATNASEFDDEATLVRRAQSGDSEAFRILVERHGSDLLRLAHRLTGSRDHAEDVMQEALLKAYRALGRFDGRSRFGTWLHRIVANCGLDHLRQRRRHPGDAAAGDQPGDAAAGDQPADERNTAADRLASLASPEPGPLRRACAAEARQRVTSSLERLTPLERAAFVLRHFEQRSLAEIGQILGRGENTVKQTVFRAVHKVRRELSPLVRETQPTGDGS